MRSSLRKILASVMIVCMLVAIIPCHVFAAGKTGWRKVGDNDYRYYITSTKYAKGWKKINGYWYYFGKDGLRYHKSSNPDYCDYGDRVIKNKRYFFKTNGKLITSKWIRIDGLYDCERDASRVCDNISEYLHPNQSPKAAIPCEEN